MKKTFDTLLGVLEHHAHASPDKNAVVEGKSGKSVTYREFWQSILSYASYLKECGLAQGDRVTLLTAQTIEYLSVFYGVMLAGGIAVPVEPAVSEERLHEIASYFESKFIASSGYSSTLRFNEQPQNVYDFPLPPDDERLCVILYTTGTTGDSKGVMSSYRCRFCGADNLVEYYDITSGDTALIPLLLSHSRGIRSAEAMFVAGGTAVLMAATMFFGDVFSALHRHDCTILKLVPSQVAQILHSAEKMLVAANDRLRVLAVGSAVIPEDHKERLKELLPNVRLFNDFGSTEAVGSAFFEWSAYPMKKDCVGTEAVHSKIVFLDDDGNVLDKTSRENPGVIATEGGTLMSGYWNEPELTAEVLKDGRFISSDLGYRGDDGMIYHCGRITDIIVSGANKISPHELEDAALQIDGILECAVIGKQDGIMGQLPALFAVTAKQINKTDIITALESKIERFKVPKPENIIFLESLPKTEGTGKVIKKKLEEII